MLFLDNLQLKKEITAAQEKIDDLYRQLSDATSNESKALNECRKLEERLKALTDLNASHVKDLEKTAVALRDQTEADLILNTLRLLGIMPSRAKKENLVAKQRQDLENWRQLNQLANAQSGFSQAPGGSANSLFGKGFL